MTAETRAGVIRWAVVIAMLAAAALLVRHLPQLSTWWRGFFTGAFALVIVQWGTGKT